MNTKSMFYLVFCLGLLACGPTSQGRNLAPSGEVEIKLESFEATFDQGKIIVRCAKSGDLQELSLAWNGKLQSVPKAELIGITLADLQTIKISCPYPDPTKSSSESLPEGEEYCFVTMAYGEDIVTDTLRNVKRHVRFEFFKGACSGRFRAIPEKSGKHWKLYHKSIGKDEMEFDEHDGVLQPWSLIRDFDRD